MRQVKRFGFTALGIVLAVGTVPKMVLAQTPVTPPPPGMPATVEPINRDTARVQKLSAELSLNKAQSVQILAIMRTSHIRARAVRVSTTLTPAQKLYKLRAIRRLQIVQVASVLTPPQRMRFREIELGE